MRVEEVVVIGAGPGGIATAIQLHRYGIRPLLVEKDCIGGLLKNANLVENYPGFPQGISGPSLIKLMEEQLRKTGTRVFFEEVMRLEYKSGTFIIETRRKLLRSQIAVVASGTKPRELTSPQIPPEVKDRVFHEVYPLKGIKGKKIVIVGGGDAAFDYALNLGESNQIIIIHRGREPGCLPLLRERAGRLSRFTFISNAVISQIERNFQNNLHIKYKSEKKDLKIEADCIILAIGREPQLDFLTPELRERAEEREREGILHFVGDVKNGIFRQTAIAVGDGIRAAMKIYGKLKEERV